MLPMNKLSLNNSASTALVDDDDYESLTGYRWYIMPNGYVVRRQKNHTIYLHREIMAVSDRSTQVDHINQDKLDNRKSNLRICTNLENSKNKAARNNNSTGYKGIFFQSGHTKKPYRVQITNNYHKIEGGYFSTPEAAAMKYNFMAMQLHGEYANYNELPEFNQLKDILLKLKDNVIINTVNGIPFQM
jgi:hypothetical protein